jgi:hypothetical protein
MERIIQYLDDLEDLVYAVALIWEGIRRTFRFTFFIIASVSFQALGIFLALTIPPLAVAMASLLLVGALYRGAVRHGDDSALPA